MPESILTRQLYDRKGWRIARSEFVLRVLALEVRLEPTRWKADCSSCGRRCRVHDVKAKAREWRHTDAWGVKTLVIATLRRVRCRRCGIRVERIPWARPRSHFTRHFEAEILDRVRDAPIQAVCRQLRLHWTSVMRLVARWVENTAAKRFRRKLRRIGVDEVSYGRGQQKYLTIVWNHDHSEVVWIGRGRERESLAAFFEKLGSRRAMHLACVTMDMALGYIGAAQEHAPQADVVFDRFHIERHLTEAVNEVRKAEFWRRGGRYRDVIRGKKFLLLRKRRRLHWRRRRDLDALLRLNRRLQKAYVLKEQFDTVWTAIDEIQMTALLIVWARMLRWQRLRPLERFWQMIVNHRAGVIAWVRHRLTNAALESNNARVRAISQRGRGYRNARNLMLVLYHASWR
jgi:transposase